MASDRQQTEQPPEPRLYLIVPPHVEAAAVDAAVAAADVAAVLLQAKADWPDAAIVDRARSIAALVQLRDVAVLLQGHPHLVGPSGADGAHFSGFEAFRAGAPLIKPLGIAGVGGLATRHDAMVAGELGADYILFGEPPPGAQRPPFAAVLERVSWWTELFEVPCVGWAESLDEAAEIAAAGADFVAVAGFIWNDARGPAAALAAVAARFDDEEVVK